MITMLKRLILGSFFIAAGLALLGFTRFLDLFFYFIWFIAGIFLIVKGIHLIFGKEFFPGREKK